MTMREVRYVATAAVASGSILVLVQLVSAGLAALPLAWLMGSSQTGLALANYGPYILLNFLTLLLSMWVFLRYSHVAKTQDAEATRPESHQVIASHGA